jgi:small-conductance mechanosensitive channel
MLFSDNFISNITEVVHNVWRYTILSIDDSDIRTSNVVLALLLTILGFRYAKSVLHHLKKYLHAKLGQDKDAVNALEKIISYAIFVIYIISILEIANVPLKNFAFIGGALAIGIGLGGQNLMNSFISSLIIMVERPIKIGDIVEIDGIAGAITSIGARCVTLTSFSNVEILIPNSKVMQNILANLTFADHIVRSRAILRITKASHNNTPSNMINELTALLKSIQGIRITPTPLVYLTSVSETHYVYQLSFCYDLAGDNATESIHSIVNLELVGFLGDQEFMIEYLKLVPSAKNSECSTGST